MKNLLAKIQVRKIAKVWHPVSVLMDNVNICCNDKGMHIDKSSPGNAFKLHAKIPASSFLEYNCIQDLTLGIKLSTLLKIIKNYKDAIISISFDENTGHKLDIAITEGAQRYEYEMKLLQVDVQPQLHVNLTFPNTIQIKGDTLRGIVHDCWQLKDKTIKIECCKTSIKFSSEEDGFSTGLVTLKPTKKSDGTSGDLSRIDVNVVCTNTYSATEIHKILQVVKFDKEQHPYIFTGDRLPILVHIQWQQTGFMKLYIAPIITDEIDF